MTLKLQDMIEGEIKRSKKYAARQFRQVGEAVKKTRDFIGLVPELELKDSATMWLGIESYSDITVTIPWDVIEADRILKTLIGGGWTIHSDKIESGANYCTRVFTLKHPRAPYMRDFVLKLSAGTEPKKDQTCTLIPDGEETVTETTTKKKFKVQCTENV